MMQQKSADTRNIFTREPIRLEPREIALIEAAIAKIGAFGEVHLVIERGRFRFVRTIKSEAVEEMRAEHP